nr:MAG TPA: putative membrane protein [Caudoviricetes sp.]
MYRNESLNCARCIAIYRKNESLSYRYICSRKYVR